MFSSWLLRVNCAVSSDVCEFSKHGLKFPRSSHSIDGQQKCKMREECENDTDNCIFLIITPLLHILIFMAE